MVRKITPKYLKHSAKLKYVDNVDNDSHGVEEIIVLCDKITNILDIKIESNVNKSNETFQRTKRDQQKSTQKQCLE